MLPLDHERAVEKVMGARSTYRVSIERPSGITYVADSFADEAGKAVLEVLGGLYARHPAAATEELRVYVRPLQRGEIEGVAI